MATIMEPTALHVNQATSYLRQAAPMRYIGHLLSVRDHAKEVQSS